MMARGPAARGTARPSRRAGTLPDLIMLDGGRGQLSAGSRVLEELGPRLLADRRAGEARGRGLPPGQPSRRSSWTSRRPALQTLQRIRDEAHRFRHHLPQEAPPEADAWSSVLDQIPGVGPSIRTNLPQVARLGAPRAERLGRGARARCRRSPRSSRSASTTSSIEPEVPSASTPPPVARAARDASSLASEGDLC
mgnify:CR=1 FL=1